MALVEAGGGISQISRLCGERNYCLSTVCCSIESDEQLLMSSYVDSPPTLFPRVNDAARAETKEGAVVNILMMS